MACVIVLLFMFGLPIFFLMDRWLPLLVAIVRGDSTYLKEDILESGICEDKRKEWAPRPPPKKPWWDMTPEEKEVARLESRKNWERQEKRRRLLLPAYPTYVVPARLPPRKRDALDDLADEMFAELE